MNNTSKITTGATLGAMFFCISKAFAQTNSLTLAPETSGDIQANIVSASWHQVLNNPASMVVIPFLCVLAWLLDDLPFINSKYVAHCTVMMGASVFWLFAGPASVPKNFPYPFMVLIANGVLCGFISFLIHRQLVARIISMVRGETSAPPNP